MDENTRKLNLINDAMESYRKDELTDGATLITIWNILNPAKITADDIEWAKQVLINREYRGQL